MQSMRRVLHRWLEAWGEHITRHGWVDPTGAVTPPVTPPYGSDDAPAAGRVPQPID